MIISPGVHTLDRKVAKAVAKVLAARGFKTYAAARRASGWNASEGGWQWYVSVKNCDLAWLFTLILAWLIAPREGRDLSAEPDLGHHIDAVRAAFNDDDLVIDTVWRLKGHQAICAAIASETHARKLHWVWGHCKELPTGSSLGHITGS